MQQLAKSGKDRRRHLQASCKTEKKKLPEREIRRQGKKFSKARQLGGGLRRQGGC
jgi:hypothetical protein